MELINISISEILENEKQSHKYDIVDEYWIDFEKKQFCINKNFTNEDLIYENVNKECYVFKNEIICKKMQKKYFEHLKNVCKSLKYIGIDTVYGIILTKKNLFIFEKIIEGYPLISFTSTIDDKHHNTFENYHRNIKINIKLTKFFIFKLIYDICQDISIYHSKGYCHGDVHTGNIIIDVNKYKTINNENIADFENKKISIDEFIDTPKVFHLIDYDCVFISPENKSNELVGNSADYMIKHNRVYHSDKIGDIQRLCSIINLLVNKYIIFQKVNNSNKNFEFYLKILRLCKKIKKIESSMTLFAIEPIKYFMENIFTDKSIPRNLFSPIPFQEYLKEKYNLDLYMKHIVSNNCYYVNSNSRKIGKDFWKIFELFKILYKNNIFVKIYYKKEVFMIVIPENIKKEEIQKFI